MLLLPRMPCARQWTVPYALCLQVFWTMESCERWRHDAWEEEETGKAAEEECLDPSFRLLSCDEVKVIVLFADHSHFLLTAVV